MRVSLRLPDSTYKINFGDKKCDEKHNHHHNNNGVSTFGRVITASSALTRPWHIQRGQMGRSRPRPGEHHKNDDNVGIGIGIRQSYYALLTILDLSKSCDLLDSETVHGLSLYQLDAEGAARPAPYAGWGYFQGRRRSYTF